MAQRFFVGNGTNFAATTSWSTTSGGASGASVPLAGDDVILDANSPGNLAVPLNALNVCRSFDALTFTHTIAFGTSGQIAIGTTTSNGGLALRLGPSCLVTVTSAGVAAWKMVSTSGVTEKITSSGINGHGLLINGPANTFQFQDGWTTSATNTVTLQQGVMDLNSQAHSWGLYVSNSGSTRSIIDTGGTASVTLTGTSIVWTQAAASSTVTLPTTAFTISDTSATAKTFQTAGFTFGSMTLPAGGAQVQIAGAGTFTTINIAAPKSITTQNLATLTIGTLNLTGLASGSTITIGSNSVGNKATLAITNPVTADWLVLQDSKVTGTGPFYAGANAVDNGDNQGWLFSSPTPITLGAASSSSSVTAAVTIPTAVSLGTTSSSSAVAASITSPTRVSCGVSSSSSSSAGAVSTATTVGLGVSSSTSTASTALSASTTVTLGSTASVSQSSAAIKATSTIILQGASSVSVSGNLSPSVAPQLLGMASSSVSSTANLAVAINLVVPLDHASSVSSVTGNIISPINVTLSPSSSLSHVGVLVIKRTGPPYHYVPDSPGHVVVRPLSHIVPGSPGHIQ